MATLPSARIKKLISTKSSTPKVSVSASHAANKNAAALKQYGSPEAQAFNATAPTLANASSSSLKASSIPSPTSAGIANLTSKTPSSSPAPPTSPPTSAQAQASFFSVAGQKARLKNAYEVLKIAINPFSQGRIVANTTSPTLNRGLQLVANNPYTTAAVGAAGYTAATAGLGASSAAAGARAGAAAGGSSLLSRAAVPAAAGLAAGYFLFNRSGAAPQSQTQQASQSGTLKPIQSSSQVDNSTNYNTQTTSQQTYNTIQDSPYASLGGSPSLSASLDRTQSQIPTQNAPFSQDVGQSAEQTQSGLGDWVLPALIIGGAYVLSKR